MKYTGNKLYASLPDNTTDERLAKEIVEKYSAGTKVSVFYHPKDHNRACLESLAGIGKGRITVFVFGLVCILFAVIAGLYFVRKYLS